MEKFGLPKRTLDELLKYFKSKSEIEKVVIFGSRAKGCARKASDIDFAIWSENEQEFYKISAELEELPTPYKFDVVNYKTLEHENLKNSIDKDGIVFFEKKGVV